MDLVPECNYCDASFEDEDSYVTHLEAEHLDELGRIDRRRVDVQSDDGAADRPTGSIVLGSMIALAVVAAGAIMFLPSGGGSTPQFQAQPTPHDLWSVHYHGTMEMVVNGNRVDFSRDQYQLQADPFHFERGNGVRWHVHAKGVTLKYAMSTLGINVTESTVTYRGTTYRNASPNVTVSITVNGEPVIPSKYVLQRGDDVRIVVTQS